MEIVSYIGLLRRRWWLIAGIPFVLGLLVYLPSRSNTDVYSATSRLLINNRPLPSATEAGDPVVTPQPQNGFALNDLVPNEKVLATSTELVSRAAVLQEVIRALALPYSESELRDNLDARVVSGTQLLEITARDASAPLAAAIANETAEAFIVVSREELGQTTLSIADPAEEPTAPIGNDWLASVILAVVIGLFLSTAVALLVDYMDDRLRTLDDVEAISALPTLAVIERFRNQKNHPRDVSAAEDYRELRTNVRALHDTRRLRTLLVTSPGRGEGRSLTVLNLGYILAESGESVLLIDADLRQPSLHRLIGSDNSVGLADILRQNRPLGSWSVEPGQVKVLTAGTPPSNPSIISSPRTPEVIQELTGSADFVILDSPALTSVADAGELARLVDGVIILVEAGRTRADALNSAISILERSHATVIGVVLNKGRSPHRARHPYKVRSEAPASRAIATPPVLLPRREPTPAPIAEPETAPPPRSRRTSRRALDSRQT